MKHRSKSLRLFDIEINRDNAHQFALSLTIRVRTDGKLNSIEHVFVNGGPVDTLDAQGQFFDGVSLLSGINCFGFTAKDAVGQVVTAEIEVL